MLTGVHKPAVLTYRDAAAAIGSSPLGAGAGTSRHQRPADGAGFRRCWSGSRRRRTRQGAPVWRCGAELKLVTGALTVRMRWVFSSTGSTTSWQFELSVRMPSHVPRYAGPGPNGVYAFFLETLRP
jgi:hypothetical protein